MQKLNESISELKKRYSGDNLNAREAQRLAEFIAFGTCGIPDCSHFVKMGNLGYNSGFR